MINSRCCTVKFTKVSPNAKLPERNHGNMTAMFTDVSDENNKKEVQILGTHDTGYDMFCSEETLIPAKSSAVVPVGLKLAYIESGYWIKIESRSGLGFKHGLMCHPGIIDNGYRGDMGVKIYNLSDKDYKFNIGDKVCQLIIYPLIDMIVLEAEETQSSHRGEKGFGSSGK